MGIGHPATRLKILPAMYSSPGNVRGARRQSLQDNSRSGRQTGRVRRQGLRAFRSCRAICSMASGVKQERISSRVSRPRRRWAGHGARRAGRGAMGRGDRLARIQGGEREPGGARFIAPDADEIARIKARHAFLKPLTVPAGSYPKQPGPISSLGSWSFVLTRDRSARRCRLSSGEIVARRRKPAVPETAAGLPDHGRQHGRRRAEARN